MRARLRILLVVCCLVLAGCDAPATRQPSATETGTPATTAAGDAKTPATTAGADTPATTAGRTDSSAADAPAGDDTTRTATPTPPRSPRALAATYDVDTPAALPTNVSLVFARTALLADRPDAEPPSTVEIRRDAGTQVGPGRYPPFFDVLGIARPNGTQAYPAFVANPDRIVVNRNLTARPALLEATLAQEAVHVLQFSNRRPVTLRRAVAGGRVTVDESYVVTALLEGTAVYTESVYQRRYQNATTTRIDDLRRLLADRTTVGRISYGIYYYGARHVRDRLDSPAGLERVYESPPETTEQLLHGRDAGPQATLPVTAETETYETRPRHRTTFGELFVRETLATRLEPSVAARAAAGWGTDERLVFVDGTESETTDAAGYVWTHRWDTVGDAREFTAAFGRYLNATQNRSAVTGPNGQTTGWRSDGRTYRLRRLDDRTTALVAGDPGFVANATVTVGEDGVVVGQTPNSVGTPNRTKKPTAATRVPTATSRPPNDCIGLVTRSSSNSR